MTLLPGRSSDTRHSPLRGLEHLPAIHTTVLNTPEPFTKCNLNLSAKTGGNKKPDHNPHSFMLQRGIFTVPC